MKIYWKHIVYSKPTRWVAGILVVLILFRTCLPNESKDRSEPGHRVEQVQVIDWRSVDESVRKAFLVAGEKASVFAERAVQEWTGELRQRAEEDFLPWYFAYWNQQAMMLKACGYYLMDTPAVEGIMGRQPGAAEQMENYLEKAFVSRVLQPGSAQLRIESITRKAVEIYLYSLNEELRALQASYSVTEQDWNRHLDGIAEMMLSVEGNRQVPLLLKGISVGGGVVAVKIGRTISDQVRAMMMRYGRRQMMEEGFQYGGRYVARGFGWVAFAGMTAWDLYDHHRTVSQNLPVMRRLLNGYFEELENQVLHDPQCGIFQTLENVRQSIAEQYKEGE